MSLANPRSTTRIFRQPIHPMLVPIPIACFVGVLLTDLTYWWSAEMMWANFSAWLVTVGVIFGLSRRHFRPDRFSRQSVDPRAKAGVAARDRKRRAAHSGDAQHVRSFAGRMDFGRAVGPRAFGCYRADSPVHCLDGTIDGLPLSGGGRRMKSALKPLSMALSRRRR